MLNDLVCSEDELEDSLGGSVGPDGISNRPYRDNSLDSGGSSIDLLRLKEARIDARSSPMVANCFLSFN